MSANRFEARFGSRSSSNARASEAVEEPLGQVAAQAAVKPTTTILARESSQAPAQRRAANRNVPFQFAAGADSGQNASTSSAPKQVRQGLPFHQSQTRPKTGKNTSPIGQLSPNDSLRQSQSASRPGRERSSIVPVDVNDHDPAHEVAPEGDMAHYGTRTPDQRPRLFDSPADYVQGSPNLSDFGDYLDKNETRTARELALANTTIEDLQQEVESLRRKNQQLGMEDKERRDLLNRLATQEIAAVRHRSHATQKSEEAEHWKAKYEASQKLCVEVEAKLADQLIRVENLEKEREEQDQGLESEKKARISFQDQVNTDLEQRREKVQTGYDLQETLRKVHKELHETKLKLWSTERELSRSQRLVMDEIARPTHWKEQDKEISKLSRHGQRIGKQLSEDLEKVNEALDESNSRLRKLQKSHDETLKDYNDADARIGTLLDERDDAEKRADEAKLKSQQLEVQLKQLKDEYRGFQSFIDAGRVAAWKQMTGNGLDLSHLDGDSTQKQTEAYEESAADEELDSETNRSRLETEIQSRTEAPLDRLEPANRTVPDTNMRQSGVPKSQDHVQQHNDVSRPTRKDSQHVQQPSGRESSPIILSTEDLHRSQPRHESQQLPRSPPKNITKQFNRPSLSRAAPVSSTKRPRPDDDDQTTDQVSHIQRPDAKRWRSTPRASSVAESVELGMESPAHQSHRLESELGFTEANMGSRRTTSVADTTRSMSSPRRTESHSVARIPKGNFPTKSRAADGPIPRPRQSPHGVSFSIVDLRRGKLPSQLPISIRSSLKDQVGYWQARDRKWFQPKVLGLGICFLRKLQKKATNAPEEGVACNDCVRDRHLCLRRLTAGELTLLPLPAHQRRGDVGDEGYWRLPLVENQTEEDF